jgi:hypothetical protein
MFQELIDNIAKFGGILTILCLAIGFIFREYFKARITDHFARQIAEGARIVGVLTPQRLKWGAEIQDLIGSFCGAAHYLRFSVAKGSDEERGKIEEIDRLRHRIPLSLCEGTPLELEIEEYVKTIASLSSQRSALSDEEFSSTLDELVKKTKMLLHDNWQSIAFEAQNGAYTLRRGVQDPDGPIGYSARTNPNRIITGLKRNLRS